MDAMKQRGGKVNVDQLLQFIFPNALQHPLSTGRLYAFGMYGPLDENAKLRAGHNGKRVVSGWEIDTMCMEFEREDILRVSPSPYSMMAFDKVRYRRQQMNALTSKSDDARNALV